MKSPFAIFRKHQRVLMVILIGLAMFAFIFLDQVQQSGGQGLFPLIAVMIGAGVFWVWGTESGHAGKYAFAGGILGLVIGLVIPQLGSAAASPVKTNVGNISEEQLRALVRNRQAANSFLASALQKAYGDSPFILQFLMPQVQFGFGHPPDQIEEDVVFGYLLQHEADKLGLVVSDDAITAFIKQATNDKLGEGDFRSITRKAGMAGSQVYEILRKEMKARQAFELLAPRTASVLTPEAAWEDFLKVHMSESLEVTAVPVDAFAASAPKPNETELHKFFEKYKSRYPGDDPLSEPAFAQPRRMRIAYVEADYESIESSLPPITDEEIKAFYEENKDNLYTIDKIPSPSGGVETSEPFLEKMKSTIDPEKPLDPEFTPDKKPNEGDAKPEESGRKPEPEGEKKTDGGEQKKEEPASEKPSKPEGDGQAGKPDNELVPVANQARGSQHLLALAAVSAFDDSAPADDAKPGQPAPPALPQTKGDGANPQLPELPKLTIPDGTPESTEKTPGYRPLNDDLRSEIRDDLLAKRTFEAMEKRIAQAVTKMEDLGFYANSPTDDPQYISPKEVATQMKAYAEKNNLHYQETPLMSARELVDSDEYPIGEANNPSANPFQRDNSETVVSQLFGTERTTLYSAREAVDFLTNSRFAYWAIEDVEAHVPEFGEPGVKEQVLEAWKREKSRPKAEERANALAEAARKAIAEGKSIEEALSGQTVTGEEGGLQLTVHVTPPFSWFTPTQLNVPQMDLMQARNQPPLQLSTILGGQLENIGNDFMQAVFQELSDGDVGVVPNDDLSVYYVVQVRNRKPGTTEERESLRKMFFSAKQTASRELQYLAQIEQQQATYEWSQKFRAEHGWDGKIDRPEREEE